MRFCKIVALVVVAATGLFVVACGSDQPDSGTTTTSAGSADGADLYNQSCAKCHGVDLRGTAKGPSHLSIVYKSDHHSDDSFRSAARNGVGAHHWDFGDMQPVEGLSDADIDAIIAYVRTVQEREGFEDYPPAP